MSSVLLTIETPDGPLDLSVTAQTTIEELLELVTHGGLDGWTLIEPGQKPLDPTLTLAAAGVLDGVRLRLAPAGADHAEHRRPAAPSNRVSASDRARRVIPDRTSTLDRITTALSAFVGRRRPSGAHGPLDRMRRAWAWTEHDRRLTWLVTRPRIHRSIFIGVIGHRSDELAESLADTFAAARLERVALIDGGANGAITRRLRELGSGLGAIESGLRRRDTTSIERDLLFGRTASGTLAVPLDPSAPLTDAAGVRRLCDSIGAHAGLILLDCGSFEHPNAALLERCDQVVVSTTGTVPRLDAQMIGAMWGDGAPSSDASLYASHSISDEPTSISELAVVVAAGWSAIDAATPVPLGV